MKRKLIVLLCAMAILSVIGFILIQVITPANEKEGIREDKLQIVATFYPIYLIGLNLADQSEPIEVHSLTKLNTGCLHDYQLTTEDMKLISGADVLIINGAGMEGFLEDVTANYPQLTIIDATEGITMLQSESGIELENEEGEASEGTSSEADSEHNSGNNNPGNYNLSNYNPHVWLDPELYIQQIENVRDGLLDYLSKQEKASSSELKKNIETNAQNYIQQVAELNQEIKHISNEATDNQKQVEQQAVIFHESFAYLANRIGMKVAFTVPLDSDTALSAGDIAKIIDKVKQNNIKYLFTEEQYSDSIAKQIEAETGAKVYIIDSAVTGDGSKDSYIQAMRTNLETLRKALQ